MFGSNLFTIAGLLIFAISKVEGHAAVVYPSPRNAIDHDIPPWSGKVPNPIPGVESWCPFANGTSLTGSNGQACFWFSNGCSIGCPECDGKTRGPIPNRPPYNHKMDVCGKNYTATICDPNLRTVNTGAKCGAADDYYYYSPWRAPGSSPVLDPCGMAGGTPNAGGYGAIYKTTPHAKQGDLGSKTLPEAPSGTVWKTGSEVEVAFTIQANHGGGYQYRLCPKSQPLTEECFQKMPLEFKGLQSFKWLDGTQIYFNGTYVSEGTIPVGSTWAMNPIPRNDTVQTGKSFKPRCEEIPNCGSTKVMSKCFCSGMWGPYNLQIVDTLQVPTNIPAGEYVLGWRWDCEESTQIWSSCSDITITNTSQIQNFGDIFPEEKFEFLL